MAVFMLLGCNRASILPSISLLMGILFYGFSHADISSEIAREVLHKQKFMESYPECKQVSPSHNFQQVKQKLNQNIKHPKAWKLFCLEIWRDAGFPHKKNPYESLLWEEAGDNIGLNWVLGNSLLDNESYESSAKYLQRTHKLMLRQGQFRSPELAFSFFHRANEAISNKQFTSASHYLEWADLYDPHSDANVLMQLKIYLQKNLPWKWNPVRIWELAKKWKYRLVLFQNKAGLALFVLQWVRTAAAIFCFCLVFSFMVKKYPLIIHPYAERISGKLSLQKKSLVLAALLAFIPLAGLGIVTCVFISLLWIRPYLDVSEKKLVNLALGMLILASPLLWVESRLYLHRDKESIQALYQQVYENKWDKKLEKKVVEYEAVSPYEKTMRYVSWSILKKKMGDYSNAKILGLRAAEIAPENPQVLNNLGTIHFSFGDLKKAEKYFKRAAGILKNSPEIYFNLSQVELYSNNSYKHALQLEKALSFGREHVSDFIEKNDGFISNVQEGDKVIQAGWPLIRKTMDLPLQWFDVLNFNEPFDWDDFQYHYFNYEAPSLLYILVVAVAFLLVAFAKSFPSLSWTYELNFICKSCGRVICKHCRKGAYCGGCHSILSAVVDEDVRKDLILEIQKKRQQLFNRISLVMDALVIGSGSLYSKSGIKAIVQIVIYSVCLGFAISAQYYLSEYSCFLSNLFSAIALFPLALGYLVVWVKLAMAVKWQKAVE